MYIIVSINLAWEGGGGYYRNNPQILYIYMSTLEAYVDKIKQLLLTYIYKPLKFVVVQGRR